RGRRREYCPPAPIVLWFAAVELPCVFVLCFFVCDLNPRIFPGKRFFYSASSVCPPCALSTLTATLSTMFHVTTAKCSFLQHLSGFFDHGFPQSLSKLRTRMCWIANHPGRGILSEIQVGIIPVDLGGM